MKQPQGANISGSPGFPQTGRAPLGLRTLSLVKAGLTMIFCERLSHTTDLYFQQKTSRCTAYFRGCQHPELTHTEVTEALTVLEVC